MCTCRQEKLLKMVSSEHSLELLKLVLFSFIQSIIFFSLQHLKGTILRSEDTLVIKTNSPSLMTLKFSPTWKHIPRQTQDLSSGFSWETHYVDLRIKAIVLSHHYCFIHCRPHISQGKTSPKQKSSTLEPRQWWWKARIG